MAAPGRDLSLYDSIIAIYPRVYGNPTLEGESRAPALNGRSHASPLP
jgi:hypothetical protein